MTVLERIGAQRVVPVIRARDVADAVATARACARGGMEVVELTGSTPGVLDALRRLGDDGLVLGLGTITAAEQVAPAAEAGAWFVVSFTAPEEMVRAAARCGVAAIPGALTPTEVFACMGAGADGVKLFPARAVPPAYVSDLLSVMPALPVIVTGGLRASADGVLPWLDAGALAVGLGTDLGTAAGVGEAEVERRARAALDVVAAGVA
jgi:2-dehydro-3-deoxyphosphogluconate aldolase/(4S)-4-hydroxy-2-oxoglutarate aldolase